MSGAGEADECSAFDGRSSGLCVHACEPMCGVNSVLGHVEMFVLSCVYMCL